MKAPSVEKFTLRIRMQRKKGGTRREIMSACAQDLIENWEFRPSYIERWRHRQRIESILGNFCAQPRRVTIRPVSPRDNWIAYFVYAPNGKLSASHVFTLERLRDTGIGVLVVCSTPTLAALPSELLRFADALYWKALPGYDFSAYRIVLSEISKRSSGARVIILNDSVFGPFTDLRPFLGRAPWDLTGFTATSTIENHVQSYAFIITGLARRKMRVLESVFFPLIALNNRSAVILCQETRLARVASKHMTVGSFWFHKQGPLACAFDLLDRGHPFLKKSLLANRSIFHDRDEVLSRLRQFGHPVPAA